MMMSLPRIVLEFEAPSGLSSYGYGVIYCMQMLACKRPWYHLLV